MTTSRASTSSSRRDLTTVDPFSPHEVETIQAAMNRIIPSADGRAGAQEAGTVHWLTAYLSGTEKIWARADGEGFVPLSRRLKRVWAARIARLRDVYASGVAELDSRARDVGAEAFVDLEASAQDELLTTMESDEGAAAELAPRPTFIVARANQSSFDERTASFFALLVVHTRQAFYSDPVYGGNAGRVGWQTIGFPGPDSMADVVAGRYTTLPWFDDEEQSP